MIIAFFSDIKNPLSPTSKGTKRKRDSGPGPGRPETNFMKSSSSAKRYKLDPEYKSLKEKSHKHSVQFFVTLGHIGSRYYHNSPNNPNLDTLFKSLKAGVNPMDEKIFSEEKSQLIKNTVGGGIGQHDWDWLRAELKPHVILTSRSKLQSYTIGNLLICRYTINQ